MNGKSSRKISILLLLVLMSSLFLVPSAKGQSSGQNPITQPDIKVEKIEFSDGEPMEDDNITITVTVKNNDTMPLQGLTLVFLVDDAEIENISNIRIGAGESKTYKISWKAEGGVHGVSAVLKYNDVMIRKSANNQKLSVKPKPVGDVNSLLLSLGVIAVTVLLTNLIYSVIKALRIGS